MKKQLNTDAVTNELKAGSAFFNIKQPEPTQDSGSATVPPAQVEQSTHSPTSPKSENVQKEASTHQERVSTNKEVSKQVTKQESLQESNEETVEDKILGTIAITPIKPNTFRYSLKELNFVRDVVYEAEVKYKTKLDKNDVVRIALEWLMIDHQENGQDSLLARILTRKQARKQGSKEDYFI